MMTETQIQRAASDDPGGWSPEVQFLAREVVRLREDALEVVRLTDGHECGQRLRDRAEKAESNADDLRRALNNTTRDLSEALDRAEKAEAEVERLRRKISQVETDCDRVSQKLNVEKARSANIMRRAEQAEAELTKWESMEWKINEDAAQLHDRVVRAEADVKACQEVYAAARSVVRAWTHEGWSEGGQEQMARLAKAVGLKETT